MLDTHTDSPTQSRIIFNYKIRCVPCASFQPILLSCSSLLLLLLLHHTIHTCNVIQCVITLFLEHFPTLGKCLIPPVMQMSLLATIKISQPDSCIPTLYDILHFVLICWGLVFESILKVHSRGGPCISWPRLVLFLKSSLCLNGRLVEQQQQYQNSSSSRISVKLCCFNML